MEEGPTLHDYHLEHLRDGSGLSLEIIAERGYRSVDDPQELIDLGFTPVQARAPGILIPIWGPHGEIVRWQFRPDEPRTPGGKAVKYENMAGQTLRLDVPPRCRSMLKDPSIPLFITEGIKKTDRLAQEGLCVVGLPGGVWGWWGTNTDGGKTALGDWDEVALNGRRSVVVFDSDVMTKPPVRQALDRLTAFQVSRDADVWWIFMPQDGDAKVGVDDFLKDHTLEELASYARDSREILDEDPFITLPQTDLGNAERFAYHLARRACWCEETKLWYTWDGARWDSRPSLAVERMAKETARAMLDRALALPEAHPRRDGLVQWARALESGKNLREMIAWSKAELEVPYSTFDQDPWLLNCLNGTIDLRTGELRDHDPENRLTKMIPIRFDPEAQHELWDHFIHDMTAGKEGLLPFLQRAVGYSATGLTVEEKLFMIVGPTRSGKSTFVEAIKAALGEYAWTADFETFLAKKFSGEGGPTEGIAKLAGMRFVSSSEVDEGRALALAAVKQLTGGDAVTARFMYKGLFSFKPTFSLWLVANTEPLVPKDEAAMWERVLRVPFDNIVPDEKRDLSLKGRIQDPEDGGPAVLRWIVEGAVAWHKEGKLIPPECVVVSTNEYRDRMDPLSGFIEDMCVIDEGASVPVTELLSAYVRWAKMTGEKVVLGRTAFGDALRHYNDKIEKKRKANGGVWEWRGVGLLGGGSEGESFQERLNRKKSQT